MIAPFSSRMPAALARERERAGDHQQAIVVARADARALAVLVARALREVAGRPVDLVDLVGLARVGRRREREVGVAAELVEQRQLVVDAAPPAVGAAVREAPVAVDERPPVARGPSRERWPCSANVVEVLGGCAARAWRRCRRRGGGGTRPRRSRRARARRAGRGSAGGTPRRGRRSRGAAGGRRRRGTRRRASGSPRPRRRRARGRRRRWRGPTAARSDRTARTAGAAAASDARRAPAARGGARSRAATGGGSSCGGGRAPAAMVVRSLAWIAPPGARTCPWSPSSCSPASSAPARRR